MGILNNAYEAVTIERSNRKLQKQQREQYINSEEYKRRRMYDDVHIIKKWVVFWSCIMVVAFALYVLSAFFAALITMPA